MNLGIARKDSLGYLQSTYTVTMRGETYKFSDVSYLSPSLGLRGYNYLFGAHHGLCHEINFHLTMRLKKRIGLSLRKWVYYLVGSTSCSDIL